MNVKYMDEKCVRVDLSRRNLEALLRKLDGFPEFSDATLIRVCENDITLVVTAHEDEDHYDGRIPGQVHPATWEAMQTPWNELPPRG
jgi:hypothetical protein